MAKFFGNLHLVLGVGLVAGQGFNVGLRDAYELGQVVLDTPRDALGDRPMLERYVRGRRADRFSRLAAQFAAKRGRDRQAGRVRSPRVRRGRDFG